MLNSFIAGFQSALFYLFIINILLAFAIIFLERKNPSSTLAWIMILFLLPGFGILLYFMLSQNFSRKKIFKLKILEQRIIEESLETQIKEFNNEDHCLGNPKINNYCDMIRLHQIHSHAFYTDDNRVDIIIDGKDKFSSLLSDIYSAEKSIHMMYFIFKNDSLGKDILKALSEKAAQGIEVRLLLDAMGSRHMTKKSLEQFTNSGGKIAFFFPSRLGVNFRLNYRNHRKLVIIDGQIGYIGGYNIGNEYIGKKKKLGYWRDTHLRVTGSAVFDMQTRFILDWRNASKEDLDISLGYYKKRPEVGNVAMQIVSSGPDSKHEQIKQGFIKMISKAEKNIYIQTPYFIPDQSILESLKIACLSGVDVRIMIPNKPDHIFVYWATYAYVGELLEMGAKIYIYENGFLHAKNICVDGVASSIGSANFDIRSFRLDFEVNAFIYDESTTKKLEEIFVKDMYLCSELTPDIYLQRPFTIKIKESVSRLLSDIL